MTKGTAGTDGYHRVEFVYDEYGRRIQKTSVTYDTANARNNYKITDFYWSGDKLVHSKVYSREGESGTLTETADLHYHYDADGKPGIIRYNGTRFMCQYNLQGDIIGLIAGHHTQVVRYEYDAWGRIISITGSGKDALGVYNPLRYRHYQYDEETGLYYLLSRYYSPEWCRFINIDNYLGAFKKLLNQNLFTYCSNSPIAFNDPHGKNMIAAFTDMGIGNPLIATLGGGGASSGLGNYEIYREFSRISPTNSASSSIRDPFKELRDYNIGGKLIRSSINLGTGLLAAKMIAFGSAFGPGGVVFMGVNAFAVAFIGDIIGSHIENDLEADNKFGGQINFDDPTEDVTEALITGIDCFVPNPIEDLFPHPVFYSLYAQPFRFMVDACFLE